MRTRFLKWVSISTLLLAAMFWSHAANYQLVLNVVVSIAALAVVVQAVEAKKYGWAAGLLRSHCCSILPCPSPGYRMS